MKPLNIEVFQYITKTGSFDVDDIILNMIGIALGYLIIKFTRVLFVREQ
jgi:glycopeptide antibiotics resistance protein